MAGDGHELAHGHRGAVGAFDQSEEQAVVAGVEQPTQHHGEATLLFAPAALGHQLGHPCRVLRVQVGRIEEARRVPVAGHPVDRLAQPLHLPAVERELARVDDGFVADVEEAHPGGLVRGQPLLAGPHDAEAPPVAVDEVPERVPHVGALGEGTDGVGRDQADAAEDGVGDEGVAVEEPLLVVAQREVVEGPGAVPAHDVARPQLGRPPGHDSPTRRQPAVHHGAGEQVEGHDDQAEADGQQADGRVAIDGGREGHVLHADQALGRPQQDLGPGRKRMVVDPARHLHGDEAAQRRHHAAHGQDGKGGDERGGLALGPEPLALDDEEDQHAGTHDQGDDVGGVDDVQRQRRARGGRRPRSTNVAARAGCRATT